MAKEKMPKPSNAIRRSATPQPDAFAARVIASCADLALLLDAEGVVVDVTASPRLGEHPGWNKLVGQSWADTLVKDSRGKVEQLVDDARKGAAHHPRELNQRIDGLGEIPFRFTAVRSDDDRVMMLGHDIRPVAEAQQRLVSAQQSMEVEYRRLRQADTRYRVLFHVSDEAVIVADGGNRRVLEANAAAGALLGERPESLQGQHLLDLFESASRDAIVALLAATDAGAKNSTTEVVAKGQTAPIVAAAASFRQSGATIVLLRMTATRGAKLASAPRQSRLLAALEAIPDGFVVTSEDQRILTANPAFCELVQRATEDQVIGEHLERWLGRPGVDMKIIMANVREHGVVNGFATVIRGDFGQPQQAIVTAVSALDGQVPCLAFTVRAVTSAATVSSRPPESMPMPRSAEQMRQLVGRVGLKEIVRESSDLIERMCIETALDVSGNNRAAAAQLLGLSRQGLYSKLRRHGLDAD